MTAAPKRSDLANDAQRGSHCGCSDLLVPVSVLFLTDQSVYKTLPGCDCWDKKRDARRYAGNNVVVAHPPCRTWGNLKTVATKAPPDEHALGNFAVEQVRRCGGVLEHPAGSTLFEECGCGKEGDAGWLLEVDQYHWGHVAAKPTKLYIVGCSPENVPPIPHREGTPAKCITQGHGVRIGHPLFKSRATQYEREATPPAFARWLVELARRCAKGANWADTNGKKYANTNQTVQRRRGNRSRRKNEQAPKLSALAGKPPPPPGLRNAQFQW